MKKYNTKEFFYDTSFNDYKKEAPIIVVKNMKKYYLIKVISILTAIISSIVVFNVEIDYENLSTVAMPLWKLLLIIPFFIGIQIFSFQLMHKVVFKEFEVKYTSSAGLR